MPWFVDPKTGQVKKADKSPGSNWELILEAKDNMTVQQVQQLVKDFLAGKQAPGAGSLIPNNFSDPITSWLSSQAGAIGSGLEGALVYFLKDLWDVIIGPLEIIAGVAIALIIVIYAFKDDLAAAAMLIK